MMTTSRKRSIQRAILGVLLSILIGGNAYSQEENKIWYKVVAAPPSPNAASLGKFGEVPVDKATGIPSISIPLLNLSEGGIDIPISISYHAGGIKVNEEASSVGLGWALNAGGVITRSMREKPDDGYLGFLNVGAIPDPFYISQKLSNPATLINTYEQLTTISSGMFDYVPDIFYYNLMGESGSFLFDNHGIPRAIPFKDVRIEYIMGSGGLKSFKIINSNGIEYYFGDDSVPGEFTETTDADSGENNNHYVSSWYLRRIFNPLTKSEVNFTYGTGYEIATVNYSYSKTYERNEAGTQWTLINYQPGESSTTTNNPKYLSSISLNNATVNFSFSDKYDGGKKLDYIAFKNRRFDFNYDYFASVPNENTQNNLRLKLLSVVENSSSINGINKHSFDYSQVELPKKDSKSIDHWGFYNGKNNISLIPYYIIGGIQQGDGAERDPDPNYTGANMLKRINYPTGGYTDFTFENNSYTGSNSIIKLGGGMRIKQIENYDSQSKKSSFRTYDYNSSGYLTASQPTYYTNSYERRFNENCLSVEIMRGTINSNSSFCMGSSPNSISYNKVTEYLGTPQQNIGKIETIFSFCKDPATASGGALFIPTLSNQWKRSRVLKETSFKFLSENSYDTSRVVSYVYEEDNKHTYSITGFKSRILTTISPNPCSGQGLYKYPNDFQYESFQTRSVNYRIHSEVIKEFFSTNGLMTTTKNYYYDNSLHLNPTRIITSSSDGKVIELDMVYPLDHTSLASCQDNSLEIYNTAITGCIATYLNTEQSENSFNAYMTCKSNAKNNYLAHKDDFQNCLIQQSSTDNQYYKAIALMAINHFQNIPLEKQTKLNGNTIEYLKWNYTPKDNYFINSSVEKKDFARNTFLTEMTYDKYDNNLNISQVTPKGTYAPISYLWSYNGKYLVIKAENALFTKLDSAVRASLAPGINTLDALLTSITDPKNDSRWASFNRNLRANVKLAGAMVTTYTYDPLIGITSQTDPNGLSTYYEYDELGRLMLVRDNQQNIIKNYYYHYLGQEQTDNKYTITTTTNTGGTITPSNPTIIKGGSVTFTFTPSVGYKIKNVKVNGTSLGVLSKHTISNITATSTIAVEYEFDGFTVNFNSQGGTIVSSINAYYGTKITAPANPTKTGYTFAGWYKEAVCTTGWVFTTDLVTSTTTLFAKWTPNSFTVSFNTQGGTTVNNITGYYNTTIASPTPPTKTGYTFSGWYKEAACNAEWIFGNDVVTSNITLYAKWTPLTYTVSFDSQEGTAVISKTANYNSTITAPNAPSRTGYTFVGWYKTSQFVSAWNFTADVVTTNTTLYAKWAINNYTISASMSGSGNMTPSGSTSVVFGGSTTYSFTPTSGSYIIDVKVNGVSVGAVNSYTFTNVTASQAITVTFYQITIDLTADPLYFNFGIYGSYNSRGSLLESSVIIISSNISWEITTDVPWLTLESQSGSGSANVNFTCQPAASIVNPTENMVNNKNTITTANNLNSVNQNGNAIKSTSNSINLSSEKSYRGGTITISGGGITSTIQVRQELPGITTDNTSQSAKK